MSDDDQLDSTMTPGAIEVKLRYMNKDIQDHKKDIEVLKEHKTQQEGLNRSLENFKTEMREIKIESRIEDLEEWKNTVKIKKEKDENKKQSNLALWVPVGISLLLGLWSAIKDMM